jgi:hypothetical protein
MFACYATSPGSRNWRSQAAIWEGNTPKSWQLQCCLLAGQLLCFPRGTAIRRWTHIDGFFGDRSLASLNLANNRLGAEGAKVIAAMLKVRKNTACDLHFCVVLRFVGD